MKKILRKGVDTGGYGVVWDDELDLSSDELWEHGEVLKTRFDGLMSFGDATELWGLSESTVMFNGCGCILSEKVIIFI